MKMVNYMKEEIILLLSNDNFLLGELLKFTAKMKQGCTMALIRFKPAFLSRASSFLNVRQMAQTFGSCFTD